jgi:hypothetical protein
VQLEGLGKLKNAVKSGIYTWYFKIHGITSGMSSLYVGNESSLYLHRFENA